MDLTRDDAPAAPAAPAPATTRPAPPANQLSYAVATWLQRVDAAAHPKAKLTPPPVENDPKQTNYKLIYVMAPTSGGRHVALCLYKARLRPNGDVAAASPVSEVFSLLSTPPTFMTQADEDLIRFFVAMRSGQNSQTGSATEPRGKIGAALLNMLAEQDKLLWANSWADVGNGLVYPLKGGVLREANLAWREEGKGLRLGWQVQPPPGAKHVGADQVDYMLPTDPPWYIDNLSCGVLQLNQGGTQIPLADLQALVAQAPLLTNNDKMRVSQLLLAHGLQGLMPLPQPLPQRIRDDVKPRPVLTLDAAMLADGSMQRWNDFAVLSFDYDGERVSFDPSQRVVRQKGEVTEIIQRDSGAEDDALAVLTERHFVAPTTLPLSSVKGGLLLPTQAEWIRFARDGITALKDAGWKIEKTVKYRYDTQEVGDWYAQVEEDEADGGRAWFELELGIMVEQERVPLLPVLVQLIRNAPNDFNPKVIANHGDEDQMLATLPDGSRVALPWGRVRPILNTLGELYFSDKIKSSLRMATLDAARLDELARNVDMTWTGGEELRDMGARLNQFGAVKRVATPAGLQATLRDYQTDGLSWMQFLREYGFAGILADDMGLGKTVQTLAHILVEKEAGRLTAPALVIAPTSLMGNWQEEAARFAPGLKVLLLQGKDRMGQFDQIDEADLVLTTYALLPRDEEKLREHDFHLVILDESHYIKNTRSKAAQSAGLLRARHRLCLSGTPLENHLGELWSQFHFLLPGLLGDEKGFNTVFRHPIERQDDPLRRALLNRRIKPFLLRRTKDSVAKELPPKTEMVRKVELTGAQRDLYETVRLAMDQKVREEIDRKGVARSQIVILEALLKLRQVCCDPRLVKSTTKKQQAAGSAKLADLMQMVEDLLEEKRKILVFSQFTSMLELIEEELEARDIPYALLTGDTKDRSAQVAAFQQGAVPIFLISLKAGGVGLNLTAADTVIHYDPWWNPAAENQATDRAWRIGQDKPVFVYKLIAKGTLEEKIQVLQQKKSDLAQSILAEGESQKMALTQEDLQQIFAPLVE
ncbi:Helicase conserved C-terminal domain-containing protein [Duganella sp. CF402]|uniref:DEAD/DEAH box helicase n=1 Tax=unclassified Duganella TaxID=2636909 RepID=UPI0008B1B44C|nr:MULTISPECIES: DEAD/DEAH box helicase [unclassified Duganella]RZT05516.1 helicase-like protein [Duganella sp. BK701]SEN01206.1 Helicase conserved C-terminal domain-containing protein [Duganella sp. CF402]